MATTKKRKSRRRIRPASLSWWRHAFANPFWYAVLAVIIGVGMLLLFAENPGMFVSGSGQNNQQVIATVNGSPITRAQYDQQKKLLNITPSQSQMQWIQLQGALINQLIMQRVQELAAKKLGLKVNDADISKALQQISAPIGGGKPVSQADLSTYIQQRFSMSLNQLTQYLHQDLLPQKLQDTITSNIKVTEDDLVNSYKEANLREILIGTLNSPLQTPNLLPSAQAKFRAQQILTKLQKGTDFAQLANQFSSDPLNTNMIYSAKLKKEVPGGKKGGNLGWVPLIALPKPVSQAALALKPGQISGVIKTNYGYYIIQLLGIRESLPKDFAKKKATYLTQLETQEKQQAWASELSKLMANAKIVIKDPSLKWKYDYFILANPSPINPPGSIQNMTDFIAEMKSYVSTHASDGDAALALASLLYSQQYATMPKGQQRKALRQQLITYYTQALATVESRSARFNLADLYRQNNQNNLALEQYKMIQQLLSWDQSPTLISIHQELMKDFIALGQPALAAQEQKTIQTLQAQQKASAVPATPAPGATGTAAPPPPAAPPPAATAPKTAAPVKPSNQLPPAGKP